MAEEKQMEDKEILHEIFSLQKESNERDTRMETQLLYMDKRLTNQEDLLAKMSQTLERQKHLNDVVDTLAVGVTEVKMEQKAINERITKLEQKPAQNVYGVMKKIVWILIPICVTGIIGSIWTGIKLALKG